MRGSRSRTSSAQARSGRHPDQRAVLGPPDDAGDLQEVVDGDDPVGFEDAHAALQGDRAGNGRQEKRECRDEEPMQRRTGFAGAGGTIQQISCGAPTENPGASGPRSQNRRNHRESIFPSTRALFPRMRVSDCFCVASTLPFIQPSMCNVPE